MYFFPKKIFQALKKTANANKSNIQFQERNPFVQLIFKKCLFFSSLETLVFGEYLFLLLPASFFFFLRKVKPQFKSFFCLFALTYKNTTCFHWRQHAACYIQHVFQLWYQCKQPWGSTIEFLAREKRNTNVRVLVCLWFNTHTCIYTLAKQEPFTNFIF